MVNRFSLYLILKAWHIGLEEPVWPSAKNFYKLNNSKISRITPFKTFQSLWAKFTVFSRIPPVKQIYLFQPKEQVWHIHVGPTKMIFRVIRFTTSETKCSVSQGQRRIVISLQ